MAEFDPGFKRWKGKTTDLSKREVREGRRVGKAGRKRISAAEAKAAQKDIDISGTEWREQANRTGPRAKGGIAVSKETGQAITGRVKLPDGSYANYVRGKRVRAQEKPSGRSGGGAGGMGGGGGGNDITPPDKPKPSYSGGKPESTQGYRPMTGSAKPAGKAASLPKGPQARTGQANVSMSSATPSKPSDITFGGRNKPTGKEAGPGVSGVKNPKDGALYRFGPPDSQTVYRWNAKTNKFIRVRDL